MATESARGNRRTATNDSSSSSSSNQSLGRPGAAHRQEPTPLRCFFGALTRKKPLDGGTHTDLNRCLTLVDLTTLGVGSTLGLGLYVLAGQVASIKSGPAVVVSFGLAALASAFSALCYAEFAGRVPKAGSAYAYSYITVGEFVAFVIGWNLILEYVIGASSVARGFSGYLVYVCKHIGQSLAKTNLESNISANLTAAANTTTALKLLANATATTTTPADVSDAVTDYVVKYFDWPSVVIVVVLTCFILFGVKESTNVTMVFTVVNMVVVLTVVFSSLRSLNLHNWQLARDEVPAGFGEGGFLPYGWSGVLAGSATCFFGFIGFDTIASSAEEARNPKRNVPIAIILSLFISFVAYVAIAIVQTLLWPYYDQNKITILPYIFARLDSPVTYWIVLLGAIAGLASSQLGGMYPLPRILYSMAQDRLIYGYLAHVNKRLKLPVRATIVGSVFIALLSCLLDIQDLADMVSIGTLAAYSLVSLSVLIVRYEHRPETVEDSSSSSSQLSFDKETQLVGAEKQKQPNGKNAADQQVVGNGHIRANEMETPVNGNSSEGAKFRRPKLLDLLVVWNTSSDNDDFKTRRLLERPDEETSRQSKVLISCIVLLTVLLDLIVLCLIRVDLSGYQDDTHFLGKTFLTPQVLLASSAAISLIALLASNLMLSRLPTSEPPSEDMFQVPMVPLIPTLSILVNTFLMLNLSYLTWVRFTVWMSLGLFIYFTYGIWNSVGYLLRVN